MRGAAASGETFALLFDANERLLSLRVEYGVRVRRLDAVVPPFDVLLHRVFVDGAEDGRRLGVDERHGVHHRPSWVKASNVQVWFDA